MESRIYNIIFIVFCIITAFKPSESYSQKTSATINPDYKNFYGVSWRGTPHENLAYAKQMNYDYVFYQPGMENDPLSNGLHFYIETPEYLIYNRAIDTTRKYSQSEKNFYERNFAIADDKERFPKNLATGWEFNTHTFTPILDFQQKRVVDWAIDSILKLVNKIETRNANFKFGGFAWDVPQLSGDFWKSRKQSTLAAFTGGDFGRKNKNITHDYPSYTNGHGIFYKKLFEQVRAKYPTARFIIEPYKIYEEWIGPIQGIPFAKEIMPDIILQEGPSTDFIDDARIFDSGLISKDNIGCSTPNKFGEAENRLLAAKAAINGALFTWYGRFGGTGDMPNYKSIREVPARLKLIRELTNWENLNGVPLANRKWDGNVYKSDNAFVSQDLISVTQPRTKKVFFVFLTKAGALTIPNGKKITAILKTDDLFVESGSGMDDFDIHDNIIKPKDAALNQGYIMELR